MGRKTFFSFFLFLAGWQNWQLDSRQGRQAGGRAGERMFGLIYIVTSDSGIYFSLLSLKKTIYLRRIALPDSFLPTSGEGLLHT